MQVKTGDIEEERNMKRSVFKTIGVLILAIAMSLTMGTAAFAADMGTGGTVTTNDNSVVLKKAIKITNHSGYAYEPTITYTYTLANGTAGGTVSDENGNKATFKAGSVNYLATGSEVTQTAVFSKSETATSGQNATKDLTWTFDPTQFPSAGVYRYKITETATSVAPANIGIVRPSDYDTTKYLDVYVHNNEGSLQIYGYALVDDEDTAVDKTKAKSQGWNANDDLETYDTYNITVTKTIAGTLADMTAKFPVKVTLTGNMSAANIAVAGTGDSIGINDGVVTGNLGTGKTLIIKGLPTTVKFTVAESNSTADTYAETVDTLTGITGATKVEGDLAGGATDQSVVTGGDISKATDAVAIGITNELNEVSPTNVIVRFAPYLFILGAAVLLIVMMRRRRAHREE